ncbi:MAG: hypothetical protein LBH71_00130 [Oscillospiraceae bacterium]|jgi:hypothetical protein|nr:hypothetical protein [Oscillospiraceae bacterium]
MKLKIKGRVKSLTPNIMMSVFSVAALITVPIRTYQNVSMVEPDTGFFYNTNFSIWALYIILFASVLLLFIMAFLSGSMPKPSMPFGENKVIGFASAGFAITLLSDAVFQVVNFIDIYKGYSSALIQNWQYFLKTGCIPIALQAVFAIMSAVYFFIFATSYFTGNELFKKNKYLALSPIVWGIFRVIFRFIQPINFRNISQLLLELIMIVLMLVFFLTVARIASKVDERESMWLFFASGLSASLFALVCTISPIVMVITGNSSLVYKGDMISFCDIGFACFAISLMLEIVQSKKDRAGIGDEEEMKVVSHEEYVNDKVGYMEETDEENNAR